MYLARVRGHSGFAAVRFILQSVRCQFTETVTDFRGAPLHIADPSNFIVDDITNIALDLFLI